MHMGEQRERDREAALVSCAGTHGRVAVRVAPGQADCRSRPMHGRNLPARAV